MHAPTGTHSACDGRRAVCMFGQSRGPRELSWTMMHENLGVCLSARIGRGRGGRE